MRNVVDQPVMRFSLSSGRRPLANRSGCLVVGGILAIIGLVTVLELTRSEDAPPTTPSPTPTVTVPATPTPSATPVQLAEYASSWVNAVAPTTTPTPWVPAAPPLPRRREPSPTPSAASCISATYDALQLVTPPTAHVLINISATNRCRRVLHPTDVLFRVSGFREGALVQTAQGSPFEEISPGHSTRFGIGLPGSLDWYDRITVEVID